MDEYKRERFIRSFNLHRASLQRYFSGKGMSDPDSEDLTQETFLRAFRGLEGFREEADFKTWIFRIAENVFRQEIRRRRTAKRDAPETALDDPSSGALSDSSGLSRRVGGDGPQLRTILTEEYLKNVRAALEALPPRMKNCIVLYVAQGRKYREIAALLHLSISTVKSHIHQARTRLRQALGDDFDGLGL